MLETLFGAAYWAGAIRRIIRSPQSEMGVDEGLARGEYREVDPFSYKFIVDPHKVYCVRLYQDSLVVIWQNHFEVFNFLPDGVYRVHWQRFSVVDGVVMLSHRDQSDKVEKVE